MEASRSGTCWVFGEEAGAGDAGCAKGLAEGDRDLVLVEQVGNEAIVGLAHQLFEKRSELRVNGNYALTTFGFGWLGEAGAGVD